MDQDRAIQGVIVVWSMECRPLGGKHKIAVAEYLAALEAEGAEGDAPDGSAVRR